MNSRMPDGAADQTPDDTRLDQERSTRRGRSIIKLGTDSATLTDGSFNFEGARQVGDQIEQLSEKHDFAIVTSGAVPRGRKLLGLPMDGELTTVERQLCFGRGQRELIRDWQEVFPGRQLIEIEVTHHTFHDPVELANIKRVVAAAWERGYIPIFNTNDMVAPEDELAEHQQVMGDNDLTAVYVAFETDADRLIAFTGVGGLHDKDPSRHDDAMLIPIYEGQEVDLGGKSPAGTGGMASKKDVFELLSHQLGTDVYLTRLSDRAMIDAIEHGRTDGTVFRAQR